ncbi:MAG: ATP-binding cassette domain-containing protein, partial [Blautia sp.]
MEPVLKVEGVTKVFKTAGKPDFKAVDKVDFVLYPGETLGIVGESGSGKSTLAKLITRLADVTAGSLSLCGEDITHAKGKKLRNAYQNIQMVFQNPVTSFDPRQTLGKGIGESLKNRGVSGSERKQQVLGLLKQCGLSEEFYNRYPHEVSGGQCQ